MSKQVKPTPAVKPSISKKPISSHPIKLDLPPPTEGMMGSEQTMKTITQNIVPDDTLIETSEEGTKIFGMSIGRVVIIVAIIIVLCIIGYFGWTYWKQSKDGKKKKHGKHQKPEKKHHKKKDDDDEDDDE